MGGKTRYALGDAQPYFETGAWNIITQQYTLDPDTPVAIAERGNPAFPNFAWLVIRKTTGASSILVGSSGTITTSSGHDIGTQQFPLYITCASPGAWVVTATLGSVSVLYYVPYEE